MWKWNRLREWTVRSVGTADVPTEERLIGNVPGKAAKVPGKCMPLHKYLVNRFADSVVLTFGQLEDLLGCALPDSARVEQGWWTSTDRDADKSSCSDAWILAGRTARPNLLARTVAFERRAEPLRASRAGK
jgi:hypothetical protein